MTRSFAFRVGERAVVNSINTQDVKSQISIYPNPVIDNLYVNVGVGTQDNVLVEIATLYGQKIATETFTPSVNASYRINVSDLSAGVYILKVQTADKQSAIKFIKK